MSVIGGKSDRTETVRALQASMGFVRHELGKRLRIKRIPALHVLLDDSAERGTRVLHLLGELEAGVDPQDVTPVNELLPTPVKRLPHEGDAPDPVAADDGGGTTDPDAPVQPSPKARSPRRHPGGGHGVDRAARGGRAGDARKHGASRHGASRHGADRHRGPGHA